MTQTPRVPVFSESEAETLAFWRLISGYLGLAAALIGTLVLAGWALDISLLKSIRPDWVSMKVNTAIAVICAGLALRLKTQPPTGTYISRVLAFTVSAIGGLSLMEYLSGADLGIDQWLFTEAANAVDTLAPNRMAPTSAGLFVLIGIALWMNEKQSQGQRLIQAIVLTSAVLTFIPAVAFLYNIHSGSGLGYGMQLSAPLVLALLLLLAGLLCAQPEHGVMVVLRSRGTDGEIARRILPLATLLPILIGGLSLTGQRNHWFEHEFENALTIMTYMAIFWVLTLWTARIRANRETALTQAHLEVKQLLAESDQVRNSLLEMVEQNRIATLALQKSEARFHRIFEKAPLGMALLDTTQRIFLMVNPQFAAIVGRSPSELIGSDWASITHPNDLAQSMLHVSEMKANNTGGFVLEKRYCRPDGSAVWVTLSLARLDESAEKSSQHIAIIDDITDRKQFLSEREKLVHDLGERIKELRCLNAVAELTEKTELPIPELLAGVTALLPPAFMDPEQLQAAINSDWGCFWSSDSPQKQPDAALQRPLQVNGTKRGSLSVWYTADSGQTIPHILPEEETLMDSVARLLSDAIGRRLDAEQVQRLSSLYEMLSATNRALVYCRNSDELLANIFEALVSNRAFPILFIAMSDQGSLPLRLTHQHGIPTEFQPELSRILSDPDSNLQRSYSALTEGKAISIPIRPPSLPSTDSPHERWLALLQNREITARAVIPLLQRGRVIGIITLYARHGREFLDGQQMQLLNEMAADLSFGLNTMQLDEQRQQAERKADLSESRFRDLFEASPVPMQIISAGGESLQASNQAHRQWLGYDPEELLTEDMAFDRMIADPEHRQTVREDWHQAIADAVAGKVITSAEMDVHCKDGSNRIARYTVRSNAGNLIVVWNDLTDIRQQEQKLIESERRFRGMIEQTVSGIYVHRDGIILYANPRMCAILGVTSETMVGRNVLEFTPADPDNVSKIMKARQLTRDSNGVISGQMPAIRADGVIIEVGLSAKSITWDDGLPATIVMAEDITEKKEAQDKIARYVLQLEGSMKATLQAISNMVELRDPYTAGHERRVGLIAGDIALEMGWDAKRCKSLEMIGLVHDIGKIAVPSEILTKPTRLTHVEMEIIKCHAQAGYDILKDVPFEAPVAETIRQHHERMDGSGYPQGLRGDEILPEARVLAVADVVESMAAHRPYRAALGIKVALAEIERGRGSHYDADAVDALLRLVNEKGYELPQ